MQLSKITIWLFLALLTVLAVMALFPLPGVIFIGMLIVPALVIIQAIFILRKKKPKPREFDEDQWYQHH